MKNLIDVTLITGTVLIFTACTSSMPTVIRSPSYQLGEKDGCTTATGNYTKNSDAFKINIDYKNGWYSGRKNCNPSQQNER